MDGPSREHEIRSRLSDITGPDPEGPERVLLGRLIRNYLARTPGGVDQLAELMRGGSALALRDHAHGLKGSAANLGADTLAAIFAEVEHAARSGVVPDPELTLGRVLAELMQVQAVLESLVGELDA